MYQLKTKLLRELKDMTFLLKEAQKKLGKKKLGTLSVKVIRGNKYYYETKRKNGKARQRYLGAEDDERLGEYIVLKVLKTRVDVLKKDIALLKNARDHIEDYSTDAILSGMRESYKTSFWGTKQVEDLEHMYGKRVWEIVEEYRDSETNEFVKKIFERDIITCDGTRVRSKGECIIYDLLKAAHIKFVYEPTLIFFDENGELFEINPDFYIECEDGSHIIIEHLGLLDKKAYSDKQEYKLRIYHLNGYDLGHNLIFTSDNKTFGLDSSFISDIIDHVVLPRAKKVA